MLREYDDLEKQYSQLALNDGDEGELKAISDQLDEIIREMSGAEVAELLSRPYPPQYKAKIKQLRGE
jgi:hypothetical protein